MSASISDRAEADESGPRCFLLSPANSDGERGRLLLRAAADFPLARRLGGRSGAPIGEVYAFVSGLYFRGKLAYARAFARRGDAIRVIVPGRGLRTPETAVTLAELRAIAAVPVDLDEPRYREPLARDARALASAAGHAVLLGSVATGKYLEPLSEAFGSRIRFPLEFVGRGDMSRGGLMLRCVDEGRELRYVALEGAPRRGPRPPRLGPRRHGSGSTRSISSERPRNPSRS